MPHLLATAGLAGAEVSYLGDTTIGLALADQARADLVRVAVAVGLVNLLLLVLFLRALIAPLYLLVINVLAVGATLGLTAALFQCQLGQDGLIFFVPFTAAVLLVSLGSDYTVFSVGYLAGGPPQTAARGAQDRRATRHPRDQRRRDNGRRHQHGEASQEREAIAYLFATSLDRVQRVEHPQRLAISTEPVRLHRHLLSMHHSASAVIVRFGHDCGVGG
ncbi:MAG: MMPL family transporter [Actinomycetota bacterium]|nr:MMPL family transporter [Actinomycetota bacterium]